MDFRYLYWCHKNSNLENIVKLFFIFIILKIYKNNILFVDFLGKMNSSHKKRKKNLTQKINGAAHHEDDDAIAAITLREIMTRNSQVAKSS